jgi:hypothetical protein
MFEAESKTCSMRLIIVSLLLLQALSVSSQSFDEALQLLQQNKIDAAKTAFTNLKSGNQAAECLLALSLIESHNGHQEEAFNYFQSFFNVSPDPYPYIYAFWTSGIFGSGSKQGSNNVKSFMMRLADDAKADATLRSMAADNVGGKLAAANKIADSKSWYAKMGDIKNWNTVGTFQNFSASGFNKDFGVLAHPEESYSFTNSTGAPVNWFSIPDARNDRWLDFNFHYDISNSIIYAQTFLQANADMEVKLLLGVSGSFKIWMNDALVGSEQEERNTDIDVYNYQVKLQKGYNRILIQIGSSELNN